MKTFKEILLTESKSYEGINKILDDVKSNRISEIIGLVRIAKIAEKEKMTEILKILDKVDRGLTPIQALLKILNMIKG